MKQIIAFDTEEKDLKIRITIPQINKILKNIMKEHNFSRRVKPYQKTPASVTEEDINE